MPKRVLEVGEEPTLIEELGGLEVTETATKDFVSLFGNGLANPPSRYLARITPDIISTRGLWEEDEVDMSGAVYSQPLSFGVSNDEFRVGDWVFHKKFGQGVVMDCFPDKTDLVVTVAFEETGTKRMLLSMAHLEKIER